MGLVGIFLHYVAEVGDRYFGWKLRGEQHFCMEPLFQKGHTGRRLRGCTIERAVLNIAIRSPCCSCGDGRLQMLVTTWLGSRDEQLEFGHDVVRRN